VKFSNGAPITPAVEAYTLQRDLTPSLQGPAASFWSDLVGESAFAAGKTKTISGIITTAQTLTLKLTQPDASVRSRMAMPWLCPVPIGTPAKPVDDGSLEKTAASGPYMLKSFAPSREVVLVRNPNYSAAVLAKRGYFDEFDMPINVTSQQYLEETQAGQMDAAVFCLGPAEASSVRTDPTLLGRVFSNPVAGIRYITMNNDVAPFNNIKVRQAVNYAIDRTEIAKVIGGPTAGRTTDQILPPTMPGWQPYWVYPKTSGVASALTLMRGSGVRTPITVTADVDSGDAQTGQVVQADLAKIGINLKLHVAPYSVLDPVENIRKNRIPMRIGSNWSQDFPDPEDFFTPLLDPRFVNVTGHFAHFDVPSMIPQFVAAQQAIDPARRAALYNQLDDTVMRDYAPWAVLYNPVCTQVISSRVTGYVYHPVYNVVNLALLRAK
jgi:ABC-type transport system substrate-binding protein